MPPMRPPTPDRPSPQLAAQISRDFGSMDDFQRTLDRMLSDPRHGGDIWLVMTPGGRLRLVRTPPNVRPRGLVLFRFPGHAAPPPPPPPPPRPPRPGAPRPPRPPQPPRPDWREASERFGRHMDRRPPYPMP